MFLLLGSIESLDLVLPACRCSCVFGLEDSTEQGPVHSPRRNSFGAVGLAARHALLADVDLPAAEIGGGWFHGLGVGG